MKTIKFFLILSLAIVSMNTSFAQQYDRLSFDKGQINVQIGAGMIPLGMSSNNLIGNPSFAVDYGFTETITLGAFFVPTFQTIELKSNTVYGREKVVVGTRMLGHFNKLKFWDIYGGFQVGLIKTTSEVVLEEDLKPGSEPQTKLTRSYQGKMLFSPVFGWKFQPVKSKFGAFIEFGFDGTSFGTLGISYRK